MAWRLTLLALLLSLLSSCGFHLRGNLPLSQFPAIYVQSEAHSELAALLKQRLSQNQVELLSSYQQDRPALQLVRDTLRALGQPIKTPEVA